MALLQNIGASNKDDAFYRYKMPVLRTRVESRGNGIATRIENMADIARALARPAPSITKYFRHKLGATSVFDDRTGTCLVHGAHGTAQLAGLLDTFITKYVRCYGCGNPETEIVLVPSSAASSGITTTTMTTGQKKKKMVAVVVSLNCTACGFVSRVGNGVEDKIFTTKDLQQPSDLLLDKKKGGRRKDKKLQRAAEKEDQGVAAEDGKHKKDAKKKKGGTSKQGVPTATAGGGQLLSSPITHHDQLAGTSISFGADDADEEDDDDVQWQTDTSLEAQMKRMQEQLTAGLVMLSSTDEPPEEE